MNKTNSVSVNCLSKPVKNSRCLISKRKFVAESLFSSDYKDKCLFNGKELSNGIENSC